MRRSPESIAEGILGLLFPLSIADQRAVIAYLWAHRPEKPIETGELDRFHDARIRLSAIQGKRSPREIGCTECAAHVDEPCLFGAVTI